MDDTIARGPPEMYLSFKAFAPNSPHRKQRGVSVDWRLWVMSFSASSRISATG